MDFASQIWQLREDVARLREEVNTLLEQQKNDTTADDIREQGLAIRNMTMVLERVVNQVFPEQLKDEL